MDKEFKEQLDKVKAFHGHLCGGIVIGTKLSMYALRTLGMELGSDSKDLLVFTEIDKCMSDAVQVVTGCTLGKGTLKSMNYGKFATTFYQISTGRGIRVTDVDANKIDGNDKKESKEELIERFINTPEDKLFKIQNVEIRLDKIMVPGKNREKEFCSVCKEVIKDGKHILRNGEVICKSCGEESYYKFID
ncbi:FmdE family protein [Methanobrevibacter filiformis]|uniref:FmdE, molybdenum formylmethanofuran dehydrogenase operon n=1 Tax=Methanobrevibacter filiformis TaxID=55758 RepID=A0A165ZFG9_9EURY|nr:FmdE family protein [Methanobrevibacter filiformis]KZX10644.1 FmdE, molybdenum formylmethanofuran dehydrogenase operon [Methanobrevibacter filiformis]